jgi:hypothetical protein
MSPEPMQTGGATSVRPVTRLQHGITESKTYTDGTIRWGMMRRPFKINGGYKQWTASIML